MVELALVLVLLVMLLVGIVTSAMAFGRANSIQNAAREASRFAATLPDVGNNLDQVRDVARAAALGDLDIGVPGQFICVAYIDPSGANVRLTDGPSPPPLPGNNSCYNDGRPANEERIQVVTQRESTIGAILFSTDVTLSSEAAARYERVGS